MSLLANLQEESGEELLKSVQLRGLVPMLKHEYDRGVADGRLARVSELAPEIAEIISDKEKEAFRRGAALAQQGLDQDAQQRQKDVQDGVERMRSALWRLESIVDRIHENEAEKQKLADLKARLIELEGMVK